jgi:cytochrome b subunit of formate dehydrogenase
MLALAAPAAGAGKDAAPVKDGAAKPAAVQSPPSPTAGSAPIAAPKAGESKGASPAAPKAENASPAPAAAPKRRVPPAKGSQIASDDNFCFLCHTNRDQWDEKDPKSWRLFIDEKILQADVHFNQGKGVSCTDCHGGNHDTDKINEAHAKEDGFQATLPEITKACADCHKNESLELVKGVHGKAGEKNDRGQGTPLGCDKCHGSVSHHLLPLRDERSPMFLDNQVNVCDACHRERLENYQHDLDTYRQSVHGQGLFKTGLTVTASCSDCHGTHGIYLAGDKRSTLHATNVAGTCGKCHRFIEERLRKSVHGAGLGLGAAAAKRAPGGSIHRHPSCTSCHQKHEVSATESAKFRLEVPNLCGNCHTELSSRYAESLHGQLTALGYGPAAKCSDCHGAHDILPINDPQSRLSDQNRRETCRRCHPNATANFTNFDPHANHRDPARNPLLYAVYMGMEVLLFSVFGFFGVHALLWLVRSAVHTVRHGRPRRIAPRQPAYVRFEPIHRTLHVLVIVSFLGLALTGLPLKYSGQPWAKTLAGMMGGFDATSVLHRIGAVLTVFYAAAHLSWLIKKIIQLRQQGVAWRSLLFGPDSPLPNVRDFVDLFRMARWFVGLGPKPVFERWTYWEKFDYWAVFWGVVIIGSTGLILWFPNLFTFVLPGGILNVAKIIHSEEALLATGFVFAIHFFNTHLRAEKFPLDMAILTGLVTEAELREERPEYLARIEREGRLDGLTDTAPSRRRFLFIVIGGFVALAIGLGLLAGMLAAGLSH